MIAAWRTVGLGAICILLASCGLFGDEDEELEPKELGRVVAEPLLEVI